MLGPYPRANFRYDFLCLQPTVTRTMFLEDLNELSFSQIADAYIELRKEGKSISVREFADAVPAFREEILARLPIMLLLEDALGGNGQLEFPIGKETIISGCRS